MLLVILGTVLTVNMLWYSKNAFLAKCILVFNTDNEWGRVAQSA